MVSRESRRLARCRAFYPWRPVTYGSARLAGVARGESEMFQKIVILTDEVRCCQITLTSFLLTTPLFAIRHSLLNFASQLGLSFGFDSSSIYSIVIRTVKPPRSLCLNPQCHYGDTTAQRFARKPCVSICFFYITPSRHEQALYLSERLCSHKQAQ